MRKKFFQASIAFLITSIVNSACKADDIAIKVDAEAVSHVQPRLELDELIAEGVFHVYRGVAASSKYLFTVTTLTKYLSCEGEAFLPVNTVSLMAKSALPVSGASIEHLRLDATLRKFGLKAGDVVTSLLHLGSHLGSVGKCVLPSVTVGDTALDQPLDEWLSSRSFWVRASKPCNNGSSGVSGATDKQNPSSTAATSASAPIKTKSHGAGPSGGGSSVVSRSAPQTSAAAAAAAAEH